VAQLATIAMPAAKISAPATAEAACRLVDCLDPAVTTRLHPNRAASFFRPVAPGAAA